MHARHRRGAARVSTLSTCWHGQETTVAPRSNVACPSTISVWRMTEAFDYRIEASDGRSTLSWLTGRVDRTWWRQWLCAGFWSSEMVWCM